MEPASILIDTSVFIEHIRSRDKSSTLLARMQEQHHRLITSSVVVAELFYGARTEALQLAVEKVLFAVDVLPFTEADAIGIAQAVQTMKRANDMVGFRDVLIGCVALRHNLPVATLNERDYARIPGVIMFHLE